MSRSTTVVPESATGPALTPRSARIGASTAIVGLAVAGAVLLASGADTRPVSVEDIVTTALRALGALACLWYALAALVVLVTLLVEASGATWSAGRHALERWAPLAVRRLAGAGAVAGISVVALVVPSHAVPENLTQVPAASESSTPSPLDPEAFGIGSANASGHGSDAAGEPTSPPRPRAESAPVVDVAEATALAAEEDGLIPGSGSKVRPPNVAPAQPVPQPPEATSRPTTAPVDERDAAQDGAPTGAPSPAAPPPVVTAPTSAATADPAVVRGAAPAPGAAQPPGTAAAPETDAGTGTGTGTGRALKSSPRTTTPTDGWRPSGEHSASGADEASSASTAAGGLATPRREAAPNGGPTAVQEAVPGSDVPTGTYTVVAGDSLWRIAASAGAVGDAEIAHAWQHLYAVNEALIGPDPGLIHPGTVLTVPDLQEQ